MVQTLRGLQSASTIAVEKEHEERERQRAAETKATMEERAALLKAPVLPDEEVA